MWDHHIKKEILKIKGNEQALEEPEELYDEENEDQESIIEETKEHTELVNFPCPPLTVSYDVLTLLAEKVMRM